MTVVMWKDEDENANRERIGTAQVVKDDCTIEAELGWMTKFDAQALAEGNGFDFEEA